MSKLAQEKEEQLSPLWPRIVAAYFIDMVIFWLLMTLIIVLLAFFIANLSYTVAIIGIVVGVVCIGYIFESSYYSFLRGSLLKGTFGEVLVGLKIEKELGMKLSYRDAYAYYKGVSKRTHHFNWGNWPSKEVVAKMLHNVGLTITKR
jgi:uncharacterized RDD family membrane protein YckC